MTIRYTVTCPDLGDGQQAMPVAELLALPGHRIEVDAPLMTLESDKATVDVPAPIAGTVDTWLVQVGSHVSTGQPLVVMACEEDTNSTPAMLDAGGSSPAQLAGAGGTPREATGTDQPPAAVGGGSFEPPAPVDNAAQDLPSQGHSGRRSAPASTPPYASPSVRRLARELGVDLTGVEGTGPRGRISREDLQRHVKASLARIRAPEGTSDARTWRTEDFAKYGDVECVPLTRVQTRSGANLTRSWNSIPHVTSFDTADVTDLDAFRRGVDAQRAEGDPKLSFVAFLIKASAVALRRFPRFNASLSRDGLVLKKYVNVGFAADTPAGLVVPVIRDCDRKTLSQIAAELAESATMARVGRLSPEAMRGGTFTVSSLGGVRGTGFTPIVNAPEVAILGAGRATTQALWRDQAVVPRLMLPISLSWDHRVHDGVAAARFLATIADLLEDFRRVAL